MLTEELGENRTLTREGEGVGVWVRVWGRGDCVAEEFILQFFFAACDLGSWCVFET